MSRSLRLLHFLIVPSGSLRRCLCLSSCFLSAANYDQIPVNVPRMCPLRALHIRDGFMCVNGNYGSAPNYEPNSVPGSAKECPAAKPSTFAVSGLVAHHPQTHPNDVSNSYRSSCSISISIYLYQYIYIYIYISIYMCLYICI